MLGGVFKWWLMVGLFGVDAAKFADRPSVQPAFAHLTKLRGGATQDKKAEQIKTAEQTKTGKVWVTSSFTRDHVRFAWELPGYLGAYINPFSAIEPKTIESVLLTVNSINTCPYCTGLHGQLFRMAKVAKMEGPEVEFAKVFATEAGRGAAVKKAFAKLVADVGVGKARNIRALCWALLWGKTTGNSINAVRGKLLSGKLWKLTPFDMLVFAYYGPLFLVIGIMNAGLKFAPNVRARQSTPTLAETRRNAPAPLSLSYTHSVCVRVVMHVVPDVCIRIVRVPLLPPGGAVVPLPPWCHPLAATDAAHPARWARLPRAPRARRAVWRPQPLDPNEGDCATLREERVLEGQGRHGRATVAPCPGYLGGIWWRD